MAFTEAHRMGLSTHPSYTDVTYKSINKATAPETIRRSVDVVAADNVLCSCARVVTSFKPPESSVRRHSEHKNSHL